MKRTPEERVYVDGKNKPIAYDYTAQETTVENDAKDKFPLKITEDGGARLPESLTVNFTAATIRENIQPNETLSTAFGKIRKWFSDLKAHAFRAIAKEDLAETLKNELDDIAAKAEVNVQADWSETDTGSDAFIKNKPTALPANGGTADTISGVLPIANGGTGATKAFDAVNNLLQGASLGSTTPTDDAYFIVSGNGASNTTLCIKRK